MAAPVFLPIDCPQVPIFLRVVSGSGTARSAIYLIAIRVYLISINAYLILIFLVLDHLPYTVLPFTLVNART